MEKEQPSPEHLQVIETLREFLAFQNNWELFRNNKANESTPGSKAKEMLEALAERGGTYDYILSSPQEIEKLFGKEMRERFDKNSF